MLLLAACGADGPAGPGDGSARLSVVASFYPLAEAAIRVGGDEVDVTNLTPAGAEPHDLELTPDALESIVRADLVLFVGGGFQPAVEEAVAMAEGVAVDVLEGLATLPPAADDDHDDGGHDDGTDADHDDLDEGLVADPHVWLDPSLYAELLARVAAATTEARPAAAATFESNLASSVDALEGLDRTFRESLATCESRVLVVSHAAFGYLAAAYDLDQRSITGISPEAEPDPRRMAQLLDEVQAEGVTTIFTEELVSSAVAETLAAEAGVTTAVLNPLEGLTAEQEAAGDDYGSVMRANLEALRAGLRCT